MTKFKDFGAGTSSEEKEQISFKLHGEEFTCRPEIQGKVLLELISKSGSENPADSAEIISKFFGIVLMPESYERFDVLTKDPDKIVSIETLGEIVGWLVETYTDRPTTRSEVSPSGA
jgi:hypothetical protein